jgi:ABC-type bacteriocin/lantibiotic exporter with double-glycine peptidase domain
MNNNTPHAGPFPLRITKNDDHFVIVTNHQTHYAKTFDPSAARLISAAPELLSALEFLAVWNDGEPCFCHVHGESERARYTPHDSYCDKAREALRKSKGEA